MYFAVQAFPETFYVFYLKMIHQSLILFEEVKQIFNDIYNNSIYENWLNMGMELESPIYQDPLRLANGNY